MFDIQCGVFNDLYPQESAVSVTLILYHHSSTTLSSTSHSNNNQQYTMSFQEIHSHITDINYSFQLLYRQEQNQTLFDSMQSALVFKVSMNIPTVLKIVKLKKYA